jgi:hypothetical protein
MDEMSHSAEALSPMLLCVFERDQLHELYRRHPGLAYDITWLASREEQMLDENLLSVGRRTALERAAYLIAFIAGRAAAVGLGGSNPLEIPITQQHVADTLGLSLVHTNKTLRKLVQRGLISWQERGCAVRDLEGLLGVAGGEGMDETVRPLVKLAAKRCTDAGNLPGLGTLSPLTEKEFFNGNIYRRYRKITRWFES